MVNNVCHSSYHDARLRRRHLLRASKKAARKHPKSQSRKEHRFPFHRLPREIMGEVFVLCLPEIEDYFEFVKSKKTAPLLLCNVSSSWRSLALNTPRLWNQLSIRIEEAPKGDINSATAMAESWIARSGELPLRLRLFTLIFDAKALSNVRPLVNAYLDTFFRYASRWESVKFDVVGCSPVSFPKFGSTPLLRKFSYSTSSPVSIPFPFTSCPLLSTLTWPFSCSVSSNPDMPWYQLTCIILDNVISTHQTLDILRTCQMLVEFRVEIDDYSSLDRVRSRRKPIENRSLRCFRITVYQIASGLFQNLTLPALTELSFDNDSGDPDFILARSIHTPLVRLFTRSKYKLQKLMLGDCGFDDDGILKCLKHDSCSSLKELEISNSFYQAIFTDKVILALTDKDGLSGTNDDFLLPNLSHLSLEMCLSSSPGVLGFMILSRYSWWDKDDQLKSLSLTVEDLNVLDSALLKFAKQTGFDVAISIEPYTDCEDTYDTDDG